MATIKLDTWKNSSTKGNITHQPGHNLEGQGHDLEVEGQGHPWHTGLLPLPWCISGANLVNVAWIVLELSCYKVLWPRPWRGRSRSPIINRVLAPTTMHKWWQYGEWGLNHSGVIILTTWWKQTETDLDRRIDADDDNSPLVRKAEG